MNSARKNEYIRERLITMNDNSYIDIERDVADDINLVPLETHLLRNRKIFLTGEVDMEMANDFVRQFMYLEKENKDDIDIYINGPGGDVVAGMLIYDLLQTSKCRINMYCIGKAYSMSAFLLASGPKGHRYILPHSEVMIHEPIICASGGNVSSVKRLSDTIVKAKKTSVDLLVKHTQKTEKEILKAISFDNYMTAKQAVAFGICDKVIDRLDWYTNK